MERRPVYSSVYLDLLRPNTGAPDDLPLVGERCFDLAALFCLPEASLSDSCAFASFEDTLA